MPPGPPGSTASLRFPEGDLDIQLSGALLGPIDDLYDKVPVRHADPHDVLDQRHLPHTWHLALHQNASKPKSGAFDLNAIYMGPHGYPFTVGC